MTQNYEENERILMRLVHAKDENEVFSILKDPFFNNNVKWKPIGDDTGNYRTIGNQMAKAVDALCEKPLNSIDAILIKECLKRGIEPQDQEHAPKSMKIAADKFLNITEGDIKLLSDEKRRELASLIRIIADGGDIPNIIIADRGEGQLPDKFEDTFLSINKNTKSRIKFVQGKFNMGGTGVLRFCGERKYQLILSRRSIDLEKNSPWAFTLVRLKPDVPDSYKLPWYEYFTDTDDKIFQITGKPLSILPWGEELIDGSFIKMYNYQLPSTTDVTQRGLWGPMSLKLYSPVLPLYIYEMRKRFDKIKGKNDKRLLSGVRHRVLTNENEDVRKKIPITCSIEEIGEIKIEVTIFNHSSKNKKKENVTTNYVGNDPLFLTINGQSHLELDKHRLRTNTSLPSLSDYMMVHVDLTNHDKIFPSIFMGSRDRVATDSPIYKLLISRIFADLKIHPALRELDEEYKRLNSEFLVKDSTMMGFITHAVRETPSLWKLFATGESINEFDAPKVLKEPLPYKGQPIPTYLKIKDNKIIVGDYEKGVKCDGTSTFIYFVTNAENGYDVDEIGNERLHINAPTGIQYTNFGLKNGQITIKLLPPSNAIEGDTLDEKLIVTLDRLNDEPLECSVILHYYMPKEGKKGAQKSPRKYPGVKPPQLNRIYRDKWGNEWDAETVAKVDLPDSITINVDCKYLQEFLQIKTSSEHKKIEQKYLLAIYFMAIYNHRQWENDENYVDGFNKSLRATAEGILPTISLMSEKDILKSLTVNA